MTRPSTSLRVRRARRARVVACLSLGTAIVAGCGGVDRDATREQMVALVATAGAAADPDCVDAVLDKYSDEQLNAMNAELKKNPKELSAELTALHAQLGSCITIAS